MAAACVVGVDLGGTKLLAGSVDRDLQVHHRTRRTVVGLEQPELLAVVRDAVEEVRQATGPEVESVGFGIPCMMDQRTGIAVMAVNLEINDLPFAAVMSERIGLPVFVDNDANCAMLAEHRFGVAQGSSEAVLLTIGTGIGGGLIIHGELYRGFVGAAAELGHIVIDVNGPRCQGQCPNNGCLEALASGTALAREARRIAAEQPDSALGHARSSGRDITGALVTELAHDGDPAARDAITLIGRNLGIGLANYANIFNPELMIVGGGVMAAGEMLLAPAREEVAVRALRPNRDVVRVVPAHFGEEAGMIGAATLAFEGLEHRDPAARAGA